MLTIGKMEESVIMINEYKEHKVTEMYVDVKQKIVTLTTEGDDVKSKHSMTLTNAYFRRLLDYISINKITV